MAEHRSDERTGQSLKGSAVLRVHRLMDLSWPPTRHAAHPIRTRWTNFWTCATRMVSILAPWRRATTKPSPRLNSSKPTLTTSATTPPYSSPNKNHLDLDLNPYHQEMKRVVKQLAAETQIPSLIPISPPMTEGQAWEKWHQQTLHP